MNIDYNAKKLESAQSSDWRATELTGKETPEQELAKRQLRELRAIRKSLNIIVAIIVLQILATLLAAILR